MELSMYRPLIRQQAIAYVNSEFVNTATICVNIFSHEDASNSQTLHYYIVHVQAMMFISFINNNCR